MGARAAVGQDGEGLTMWLISGGVLLVGSAVAAWVIALGENLDPTARNQALRVLGIGFVLAALLSSLQLIR